MAGELSLVRAVSAIVTDFLHNLLIAIVALVASEGLLVLIDMEEHARRIADSLKGEQWKATPRLSEKS